MLPIALTIAGSDPIGGAGIQADLKTFHQFGVYGEAVITLLTVQNTTRVSRVDCIPADLVLAQLAAVLEDIPPHAAKTGALGNREIVEAIAAAAADFRFPLVVDPVMISKHGQPLISPDAIAAVRELLLPRATLICPNLQEAEELTGLEVRSVDDMQAAAKRLCEMGAKAALVKGGHLQESAVDVLFDGQDWREFTAPHFDTPHTHGTGGDCRGDGAGRDYRRRCGARQELRHAGHSLQPRAGAWRRPVKSSRRHRIESECKMKFADLLKAAIEHSDIPLRFEPGAEDAVAAPVIDLLKAWVEVHQPPEPRSEADYGRLALIAELIDELNGVKDVPS
jgi:hydroxymethylpyrimidine/phosphomethylpyrimidine kinase